MKCLSSLTLLFLCVSAIHGSQSRSVRETIQERCNQLCKSYHRQGPCTGGLPRCGPCVLGYVERGGICHDIRNGSTRDSSQDLSSCSSDSSMCSIDCVEISGCEVCACMPCAEPQCANYCPGGYATSSLGCMTCDCVPEERIDAIEELVNQFRELKTEKEERQRAKKVAGGEKPILEAYNYDGGLGESLKARTHDEGHKGHESHDNKVEVGVITAGANIVPPIHPTPAAKSAGDLNPNNQLHPLQNVASIADVYFLDLQVIPGEDIDDEIINLTKDLQDVINTVNSQSDTNNPDGTRESIAPNSLTSAGNSASLSQSQSESDTVEHCDNCAVRAAESEEPAVRTAESDEPASLQLAASSNTDTNGVEDSYVLSNSFFIAVVAGCSVAGLIGLVVAGVCWYKLQKNVKATSEVEYPAYGITGPTKERVGSPGDRKLAQSAQMYHYQHQKQQMIAMEKANGEMKHDGSEEDSEDENEEGDYTVYECPGLAPTGEMEVKNPLFNDETPVTPTPDDRGGDQK